MNKYFVQKLEDSGLYFEHPERFAFMRSEAYSDIYGHPMYEATKKELAGYLEILNPNNGRKIYRKYYGNTIVDDQHIMLDYRSICELKLNNKDLSQEQLIVKKSSWIKYYLLNSDSGIKNPIWIAIIGLLVTFASLILTILFYMFPNCCEL